MVFFVVFFYKIIGSKHVVNIYLMQVPIKIYLYQKKRAFGKAK
jgi:hypothetical protein